MDAIEKWIKDKKIRFNKEITHSFKYKDNEIVLSGKVVVFTEGTHDTLWCRWVISEETLKMFLYWKLPKSTYTSIFNINKFYDDIEYQRNKDSNISTLQFYEFELHKILESLESVYKYKDLNNWKSSVPAKTNEDKTSEFFMTCGYHEVESNIEI